MTYEEMNQQTKDVFNALLAKNLEYAVKNNIATIEATDKGIIVSSPDHMHQMVVEAVVETTKAFELGFYVDCVKKEIIIRIY